MTRTATPLGGPLENDITVETTVGLTAEEDVRLGPTTLLHLQIDNTLSAGVKSWVKLFDSLSVTPGTDKPDIILPVPAVGTNPATGLLEMFTNLRFSKGLSYFASKEDGNEATAAPDANLALRIITNS